MKFLCKKITRYDYEELAAAALKNPTSDNLDALAAWFESFGNQFWNGEYYEITPDKGLRRVYDFDYDEPLLIGYELINI